MDKTTFMKVAKRRLEGDPKEKRVTVAGKRSMDKSKVQAALKKILAQ